MAGGAVGGAISPNPEALAKPAWWKWAIAISAAFGAVLELIDSSIVNVALNDMQGNLGATLSEIGWVVTGYAIANVVIIPLSAWLGDFFGKKRYFIFSLIGFTTASVLCGMADSLHMLIAARVFQGLMGGGLLAKAQSILYETFTAKELPVAQALFGMAVIVGPTFGPTLGGLLTDSVGWRWIFFINIPFGILAVIAASVFFLPDRPQHGMDRRIDWWGILFLVIGLASLQTMMEEGQKEDWFSSRFILTMACTAFLGLVLFVWRELSIDYPAVNLRVLRYRSLAAGSVFSMVLGMGLYGALFAIPIFTQSILGFTATQTGLLLMPGAIASAAFMIIAGQLSRFIDARIIIGTGATILALTMFNLSGMNPDTSADSLFWPLVFRGMGTVLMYLPLSLATFGPLPKKDIPAASGLFNLTQQIGGSVGIAVLTTLLAQRENFHRSVISEHVTLYNPAVQERLQALTGALVGRGYDMATAQQAAASVLDRMLSAQSAVQSFGDLFFLVGIAFLCSLGLLFFLGKAKPGDAPTVGH